MTTAALLAILLLSGFATMGYRHSLTLIWNHTFMTQFFFW